MSRVLVAAAALAAGFASMSALAADESAFLIQTGADLGRLCGAAPDHPNNVAAIHMCQGYIIGVNHFHAALASAMDEPIYCVAGVEPQPTRDTAAAGFAAWVRANPAEGERPPLDALLAWAAVTYPCSK